MSDVFFRNRKPNREKLLAYGFLRDKEACRYTTDIAEGSLLMTVTLGGDGKVQTQVTDKDSGDEYILHRTAKATGAFVGMVKADYEAVLTEIAEKCFEADVFKCDQSKKIIAYVREKYGDDLEFLWKKFPDNAIWRRKDTGKWYGALLTVSARKLGLDSDERIEIIDLRMEPEEIIKIINSERYFPGYHMNKKHWITIPLNGTVPMDELCARIETSYRLAVK